MQTRYYTLHIQEQPGQVIDFATRQPLSQPLALPEKEEPVRPLGLGFWLDLAASLAIIGLCAAFWMELAVG